MVEQSKTVGHAISVLLSLAEDGPGTVTEVARRCRLNRTVAHRLLATLDGRRMVRRSGDGVWRLGLGLLGLASRVESDVRRAARPVLEDLATRFGETAVLSLADGDEVVAVEQALGERHPVRVQYRPGNRHPQTRGAHGRAVLAFAESEHVERLLAGEPAAADIRGLLELTRRNGYAESHDELQFGASGLAAPVRDTSGRVIASLGMVAPVNRLPDTAVLAPAMLQAAAAVVERLGRELRRSA
ncbi:MAG: helix-turn-helix domain-containing protein [Euzebyales bacterium]|nr:helix-turn-helix domain-containing protein [Euzebyales bacterium]MDQ3431946.1 helix-turn-helix domain-containing protein [Actinomycetota bacterium]